MQVIHLYFIWIYYVSLEFYLMQLTKLLKKDQYPQFCACRTHDSFTYLSHLSRLAY